MRALSGAPRPLRIVRARARKAALIRGDYNPQESAQLLERAKDEDEVQHWLVEQMNARARGRFHAMREAEVAIGDRPDVIIASTSASCEVAIEVKHGGKGWTARDLESALRTQLAEDYLKKPISFSDLIAWLSGIAATITENAVGPIVVKCVGINAWKAESIPVTPKQAKKKPSTLVNRRPAAKTGRKRVVKKKSTRKR